MMVLNESPLGFNKKTNQQTKTFTYLHFLLFLSDMSIHNVNVSAAETGRIINEALELRKKRQALLVRDREPDLRLVQPIPFFTYVYISSFQKDPLKRILTTVLCFGFLQNTFFFLVKTNQPSQCSHIS